MKAVNVTLRPIDLDRLEGIEGEIDRRGLALGERNRSQAIRYAIELAWEHIHGVAYENAFAAARETAARARRRTAAASGSPSADTGPAT